MLCDNLDGWDEGGWEGGSRGRGDVYIYDLLHTHTHTHTEWIQLVVQQKLTQYCNLLLFSC